MISLIVIIPAYNEEVVIAKTIQSILYAGIQCHKIYVINDASTDKTKEISESFNVNVIDNEFNIGKANGVKKTLDYILESNTFATHFCFMDADTLVDVNYYNAISDRIESDSLSDKKISVICGRVKSIPNNWLTAFRAYELFVSQFLHKVAQSKLKTITVAPGCASTYSKEALENVIWSDDTSTEDMDSTIQIMKANGIIVYEPNAIVYTQDPNNIKDFIGQIGKRWYPGTWQVMGKHKLLTSGFFKLFNWECRLRMIEPILFVGAIVYTILFNFENLLGFMLLSYLIVIPIAFIASIKEKRFDILNYSPYYPLILIASLFLFVSKIGNLFGRDKSTLKWYSPSRYKN